MECKINLELFFMQHFCKKVLRVKVGMLHCMLKQNYSALLK